MSEYGFLRLIGNLSTNQAINKAMHPDKDMDTKDIARTIAKYMANSYTENLNKIDHEKFKGEIKMYADGS